LGPGLSRRNRLGTAFPIILENLLGLNPVDRMEYHSATVFELGEEGREMREILGDFDRRG
jgi:hypothetical protein